MKIWRNLECGYHVHYSNKRDAVKGLKKAIEESLVEYEVCTITGIRNINVRPSGHCDDEPLLIEVPTDKKGLIKFLNAEANYTGSSPE